MFSYNDTSPTVTTTKNADGSVTIYVDGTASSTVEAGTDGTSYYTYVRYSKNANGSGMVSTPTAETKYIGVYTGTSSSVPAYTSFNWSKYVGDDAAPLTVTATSVDYILSTSGTNPPADSASWQASPLAPTTTQYLWTRTTLTFSDGTTAKSYSIGGKVGEKGDSGPEAYVTITPSNIDWDAGTATLTATLHVDGAKVTSGVTYAWAKGDTALSTTTASCGVTDLNATYSCTCTWSGGKQRGTIDFAMSNSVKLAAEAGWESDLAGYYTKSEVDVEVGKVSSTVSETQKSLATVGNPNLTPWFSVSVDNTDYWQSLHCRNTSIKNSEGLHGIWDGEDGWAHITLDSRTSAGNDGSRSCYMNMHVAHPKIADRVVEGGTYTWLVEVRNFTWVGASSADSLRVCPSVGNATLDVFSSVVKTFTADSAQYGVVTAKTDFSVLTMDTRGYCWIPTGCYADFDLRISLYEGEYDGPYKPYVDQSLIERVTQAETDIEQNATDITLRATKTEAYQFAQPNLSPFFSMDFSDVYNASTNPKGYWYPHATLLHKGFTQLEDGWAHFEYTNSTSSSYYPKFWAAASATPTSLKPSTKYTFLLELRNWSAGNASTWIGLATNNATYTDVFSGSITKTVGTSPKSAYYVTATTEADITGKVLFNYGEICVYAGDTVSGDIRISLYEGEYSGPYKPYSGTQLYASQSELKITADGITSTVEKISAYKYCETGYKYSLANIKTYSAEGYSGTWSVSQDYNLRIGDTVYLNVHDNTRNCDVYIKGTITAMSSATRITMTSHGYEDILPVDTIKSTINQSSDSVKIQAKHVEIDGAAIFTDTNFQSNLTTKLDSIKVGGTNLLRGTGTGEGWGYTSFDKETRTFTRSTTATGESYIWCESRSYLMYELGTEYVLSCWAKSNGQVKDMDIFTYDQNTKNIKSRTCSVTTEWTYFIFPFKYDAWSTSSATPTGFLVRFDNNGSKTSGTEAILYVRDVKLERGNKATDWSPAPEDVDASIATAQSTANSAVKRSQRIYYRSSTDQPPTSMPTAWVTESGNKWAANRTTVANWTTKVTPISNGTGASVTKYLYLWTCLQYQLADNSAIQYSTVLLDDSTTVIDGGKIITGSLSANSINASSGTFDTANIPNLDASKINAGDIAAARIKANVISAINSLTAGQIDAERINVSEISIGQSQVDGLENDFEELSGNLLGNTRNSAWTEQNVATASNTYGDVTPYNTMSVSRSVEAYDEDSNAVVLNNDTATGNRGVGWFTKKGAVEVGVKYTFSCMVWASRAVTVQTRVGYRSSETSSYAGWTGYGSKSIAASTWTEYSCTFTVASSVNTAWEFITAICFSGNASGVTFKVAHAKLEIGDTATPWDIRISDAAKTATTYLTDGGSSGLMVHPSNDANTGVRITDKIDIVRAGTSVAEYGESMRIGLADQLHTEITERAFVITGINGTGESISLEPSYISSQLEPGGDYVLVDTGGAISFNRGAGSIYAHKESVQRHVLIDIDVDSSIRPLSISAYTNNSSEKTEIVLSTTQIDVTGDTTIDGDLTITGGITLGTPLTAAQIPSLAASKITSGTFNAARIPNLAASKITSGTFAAARIPAATASTAGAVTLPTALYSGTAKGNFTLTASAANYTRLRVFFTAANGGNGSVDVYSPDDSKFSCTATCLANSTTVQHEFAQWSISGTSVTWMDAGYVNLAVATSLGGSVTKLTATTNQITITRVEGWTW